MDSTAVPTIAGYRIERVLGVGGMSVVYLAWNQSLSRREALKVLSGEWADNPLVRNRFDRDAATAGELDHPNIVKIYDCGSTDTGQPWIAMEFVGADAETALGRGGITPRRACRIVTEVAAALDYAHSRGVVHGDVKPSNFLLGENGRVVLTDFGAAVAESGVPTSDPESEETVASMAYAAPEVIRGHRPDARSDVYALGCSLFRLLAGGQYPFSTAAGPAGLARAHLEQPPPRLSEALPWASPMLDIVIASALAKSPQQRYRRAGDLAAAASEALESPPTRPDPAPVVVPLASRLPTPAPAPRRGWAVPARPAVAAAASAAAVAAIGALVWSGLSTPRELAATPPAVTAASPTPSPTATAVSAEDAGHLMRLIPPGYPPGVCAPVPRMTDPAIAAVLGCQGNADLVAPSTATYTLTRSPAAMRTELDRLIGSPGTVTVGCPDNTQSPGPWRRLANPNEPVGTLWCGLRGDKPVLAWTLDAEAFVAVIESPEVGGLDQLYTWWASHS